MPAQSFLERLANGKILIADGATGTSLQHRGLPRGTASEQWVLEQPEQITRLHRDFIQAGADILLTCTFGATELRLEGSALAGRAAEINQKAAALARQAARGSETLVAGSMGPVGKLLKPYGPLEEEQVVAAYAGQAKALDEAGVDLLVVETQFDLAEARLAILGVRSVSKLPLICSFSYDRGTRTMMGVRPAQMAQEISSLRVEGLGINCGRSLEDNLAALKELRTATSLPIWFKPNAGLPTLDEQGNPVYSVNPEQMGGQAAQWMAAGAQIVGGCCGTSPDHLRQIAQTAKQN